MNQKSIFGLALASQVLLFATTISQAATYYVAPGYGNISTDGSQLTLEESYARWMGDFLIAPYPGMDTVDWNYHRYHAWMYIVGETDSSCWFYDDALGWAWSNEEIYPILYSYDRLAWLIYEDGTKGPRWFSRVDSPDSLFSDEGLAPRQQRFNLTSVPSNGFFTLPNDYVWPSGVGDADICLWNDDKWCAMAFTIDDNQVPDHAWWLEMGELYDFPITWFVITERIGVTNLSFNGTWETWQAIADAGHSVQSHSMTHGASPTDEDYIWEYEESQKLINDNVTGQWAGTLAYPGGTGTGPRPDLAKDFYIAGRGVFGTPNPANKINYMETNSVSGRIDKDFVDSIVYGTSGISWLGGNRYTRGFMSIHFHGVNAASRPTREAELEYIGTLRDQIWIGSFYDVVRFGQERDTATVSVRTIDEDLITFDLEDEMMDSIYDFPLTIKVRIPNEWAALRATQNGDPVRAWMVENAGNTYALVKAVPDRGLVRLMHNTEGNVEPVAVAGNDREINDADGDGVETVSLDGSGSYDPDGLLDAYEWAEGETLLATEKKVTLELAVGLHVITLTVTDNTGATATDSVEINVTEKQNNPPVADAGPDISAYDFDGNGEEEVTLNGSASSDPDGTVESYRWLDNGEEIGNTAQLTLSMPVGETILILEVTDDKGATATDTVIVRVEPGGNVTLDNIYPVNADTADRQMYDDGTMRFIGDKAHRVGGGSALDSVSITPFQLPQLAEGEKVAACVLTFFFESFGNTPGSNVDVYALPYRSAPDVLVSDYFQGEYGTDTTSGVVPIQNDLLTPASATGPVSLDGIASNELANFIQAQYDAGAVAGDYIFIRLNHDTADETSYRYYVFSAADSTTESQRPVLEIGAAQYGE